MLYIEGVSFIPALWLYVDFSTLLAVIAVFHKDFERAYWSQATAWD